MSNINLNKLTGGTATIDGATVTAITFGINDASVKVTYGAGNSLHALGTLASVKATVVSGGGTATDHLSAYVDSYVTVA